MKQLIAKLISHLRMRRVIMSLTGAAVLAFGLYNVHSFASVTEGGVLGLTLFLDHTLGISPAVSGLILNLICYAIGAGCLGLDFIVYSAVSGGGFSLFYGIFECFEPIFPHIADHPLAASVIGALFVGIGVGLAVRAGGAPSGDDALAMSISSAFGIGIQWVYLATDLTVLALSLVYIPPERIIYSLLTVILSGQIIGWLQPSSNRK